jgi:hypothetical protein
MPPTPSTVLREQGSVYDYATFPCGNENCSSVVLLAAVDSVVKAIAVRAYLATALGVSSNSYGGNLLVTNGATLNIAATSSTATATADQGRFATTAGLSVNEHSGNLTISNGSAFAVSAWNCNVSSAVKDSFASALGASSNFFSGDITIANPSTRCAISAVGSHLAASATWFASVVAISSNHHSGSVVLNTAAHVIVFVRSSRASAVSELGISMNEDGSGHISLSNATTAAIVALSSNVSAEVRSGSVACVVAVHSNGRSDGILFSLQALTTIAAVQCNLTVIAAVAHLNGKRFDSASCFCLM